MARKSASNLKGHGAAAGVAARVNAQMKSNLVTMASDERFTLKRVPSGILTIDRLTFGGFARGRHVELFGDYSAGKTYVVYCTLAAAQARGEVCALVDGERVFNEAWFRQLGGNPEDLLAYRPTTSEELGAVLQLFIQGDAEVRDVDVVGIDSVASLLPREELEKDIQDGDDRVAASARLMSRLLRRLTSQNDDTLFLWTNQWRDKIARIPGLRSTPGGHSLGFYASTRIEMTRAMKETEPRNVVNKAKFVERKVAVGQWVDCMLAKEKTGARPLSTLSFMFDLDTRRVDQARELIDLGMADGIIQRKGDHFHITTLEGEIKCHGIKRTVAKIEGDEDLFQFLRFLVEEQTAILADGVNNGDA